MRKEVLLLLKNLDRLGLRVEVLYCKPILQGKIENVTPEIIEQCKAYRNELIQYVEDRWNAELDEALKEIEKRVGKAKGTSHLKWPEK